MQDLIKDVSDFHRKYELAYDGPPRRLPPALARFRADFIEEELTELRKAIRKKDLEGQFDALIDLAYVVLGTAHLQGFDFEEGWRRVHAANMSKVRARRKSDSKRKSKFDVVKPEGWQAPVLTDLIGGPA